MKSKKGILLICGIAIALCVIGAAIFAIIKNPNDDTPGVSNPISEEEAQQMVTALDGMLSPLTEETSEEPIFMEAIDERSGYSAVSFEATDSGAVATVKVYAPDLYNAVKKLDSDGVKRTEEELVAALEDAIKNAEIIEKEIKLEFTKTEDGYIPVLTSEFLDALYGGVFRLYDELLEAK
ncbi:MAG: hypothetical protein E7453_01120 [Ruminococcaceae bacterium]|nr:hypothetical protein [Oscillospiraceae bacterium]